MNAGSEIAHVLTRDIPPISLAAASLRPLPCTQVTPMVASAISVIVNAAQLRSRKVGRFP
jgi:hypothetical protein